MIGKCFANGVVGAKFVVGGHGEPSQDGVVKQHGVGVVTLTQSNAKGCFRGKCGACDRTVYLSMVMPKTAKRKEDPKIRFLLVKSLKGVVTPPLTWHGSMLIQRKASLRV